MYPFEAKVGYIDIFFCFVASEGIYLYKKVHNINNILSLNVLLVETNSVFL